VGIFTGICKMPVNVAIYAIYSIDYLDTQEEINNQLGIPGF
jgi:hypothetical protein